MAYSTISKPSLHFTTKLYTGNGSTNAVTGVGFAPDWVWQKRRDGNNGHVLFDKVRGATKILQSNNGAAQLTSNSGYDTVSLDSDGFTLAAPSQVGGINANGSSCVAWNWKAGGAGSANTDGTINTTKTSANTTSGFSIIQYAGTGSSGTIGHGLSATPRLCIFKEIDGGESWRVWHRAAPNYSTKALSLNGTEVEFSQTNWIGTVDNSIITIGSDSSINTNGNNYICYAFAEKAGFSKFGSYVGNGNAEGPFIYTGFKPAFVIFKKASGSANDWYVVDSERSPNNVSIKYINANLSNAEVTSSAQERDLLSNGFKIRNSNNGLNTNGETYVYIAFAEEPLVANVGASIPATAK